MFGIRKKRGSELTAATVPAPSQSGMLRFSRYSSQTAAERELYTSLRESVPVIDAAIWKLIRLLGSFHVTVSGRENQRLVDDFVSNVRVNGSEMGLNSFIYCYFDSLLTYGEAVGEMIPNRGANGIEALYNASLDDVEIIADGSPLNLTVRMRGSSEKLKYQKLVFPTLLSQKSGTARGTSLLSGLPFVSGILTRIFRSVKNNWERAGDLRFAVTYKPEPGAGFSKESAKLLADEWKKAMRSDQVCDFVSLGDVNIRVIGAESAMPDCQVPVRTILEQIIAKLGIPPFLLGISWSSTERMSKQQADILTSELEYYRSVLEPVIRRIVQTHLMLCGCNLPVKVIWDDINLQDSVELSQARLNNANAAKIEKEIGLEDFVE